MDLITISIFKLRIIAYIVSFLDACILRHNL
jgi:hypothetical protein